MNRNLKEEKNTRPQRFNIEVKQSHNTEMSSKERKSTKKEGIKQSIAKSQWKWNSVER